MQQLLVDIVAAGANEIEAVDFDVVGKPDMRAEARRRAVAGRATLHTVAGTAVGGPHPPVRGSG